MSESLRVAMMASEMFPFAKSGGLGDVLGGLPSALARRGHEVSVFIPAYRCVLKEEDFASPIATGVPDAFGGDGMGYSLYRAEHEGVAVYAVGCGDLFDREGLYGDATGDFGDNALRFCRFCRGVLSATDRLGIVPDVLHCHDWQAALIPALLRARLGAARSWKGAASVYTIHNLAYQGRFGDDRFRHTGLPPETFSVAGLEYHGDMNLMKGGIVFADVLSTVSERYAREIQTPEQGEGLHGVIATRAHDLFGIMNGMDDKVWNPAADPHLPALFSRARMGGKALCREALRAELGLEERSRGALCVMVSRLVYQKGVELLLETLGDLLFLGVQLALLGTGDGAYEAALARAAERHEGRVAFRPVFDEDLAHRMFAGGDILLVPSRYEPAGLNPLYAMRYGTLPVVHAVGGLAESVVCHREVDPEHDTGFRFEGFSPAEFLRGVVRACRAYADKRLWRRLVRNAMSQDFGWDRVAPRYARLYEAAKARRAGRA